MLAPSIRNPPTSSRVTSESAYRSTNSLISSLRASGFGAHHLSIVNHLDDGHTPPFLPPSSSSSSSSSRSISYSERSANLPPHCSCTSSSTLANEANALKLLDAVANILDTDGSKVAVTPAGRYSREDNGIPLLAVEIMACGTGPRVPTSHSTAPAQSDPATEKVVKPLNLVVARGGQVPLVEHAQVINSFMEQLSLSTPDDFPPIFNRLVKYTIASHAIKVADRLKENSISKQLSEAFRELPKPSHCGPEPRNPHRTHDPRPSARPSNASIDTSSSSTSSTLPPSSVFSSSTPGPTSALTPTSSTQDGNTTWARQTPSEPPAPPQSDRTRAQTQQQYQQQQERRQQVERDRTFVNRFLRKEVVKTLHNRVEITNLQRVAKELRGNRGQPAGGSEGPATETPETFQLYFCADDGGTADEFHELLVFLLGHEEGYLGTLVSFVQLLELYHQAMQESSSSSSSTSSSFSSTTTTTTSSSSSSTSTPPQDPPSTEACTPSSSSPTPTPASASRTQWTRKTSKKFSRACTKLTILGILLRDAIASSAFKQHLHRMRKWLPRPEYQLEDLGRGKENMDFKVQSRLVCPEDDDDDDDECSDDDGGSDDDDGHDHAHTSKSNDDHDGAPGEGSSSKEEVYTLWMKMQVDHLESLYVLQRYLLSKLFEQKHGKPMVRPVIATVVSLPRTIQPPSIPDESPPQVRVQEQTPVASTSASSNRGLSRSPSSSMRGLRKRKRGASDSPEPRRRALPPPRSEASLVEEEVVEFEATGTEVPSSSSSSSDLHPWRDVIRASWASASPSATPSLSSGGVPGASSLSSESSSSSPAVDNNDLFVRLMEDMIRGYELPEGVHIILEPPPHPDGDLGVRYHPEGCLAALLHHQHHRDLHHRLQAQEGHDHASVSDAGHRPLRRHESEQPSHTRSGHESGTQEAREGSPAPNPSLGKVQSKVLGMVNVEGAGADDIQGYGNNSFRGHGIGRVGSSGPWTSGSIGSGDDIQIRVRVAESDSGENRDPEREMRPPETENYLTEGPQFGLASNSNPRPLRETSTRQPRWHPQRKTPYLIGVSRSCCSSCKALFIALQQEQPLTRGLDVLDSLLISDRSSSSTITSSSSKASQSSRQQFPEHQVINEPRSSTPVSFVSERLEFITSCMRTPLQQRLRRSHCSHQHQPRNMHLAAEAAVIRESIYAGAQCVVPPWVSDEVVEGALKEVRRRLVCLVGEEWRRVFCDEEEDLEEEEEEDYSEEGSEEEEYEEEECEEEVDEDLEEGSEEDMDLCSEEEDGDEGEEEEEEEEEER